MAFPAGSSGSPHRAGRPRRPGRRLSWVGGRPPAGTPAGERGHGPSPPAGHARRRGHHRGHPGQGPSRPARPLPRRRGPRHPRGRGGRRVRSTRARLARSAAAITPGWSSGDRSGGPAVARNDGLGEVDTDAGRLLGQRLRTPSQLALGAGGPVRRSRRRRRCPAGPTDRPARGEPTHVPRSLPVGPVAARSRPAGGRGRPGTPGVLRADRGAGGPPLGRSPAGSSRRCATARTWT